MNYPQAQVNLVEQVAYKLCYPNNTITTLEIKLELRKSPYNVYPWPQHVVSEIMMDLQQQDKFDYQDNGVYRVYSISGAKTTRKAQIPAFKTRKKAKVKRTRSSAITDTLTASQLISSSKGKFLTVTLVTGKKINGRFKSNDNGVISMKRLNDNSVHIFRDVNITSLSLNYVDYKIQ